MTKLRVSKHITCPVLMTVPDAHNENAAIIFDDIDDQMRLERMDPYRRRNLVTFTRHPRIGSNKVEDGVEFLMITSRLRRTELAQPHLGNLYDIVFCLLREAKSHLQISGAFSIRASAAANSSSFEDAPIPLVSPSSTKCCIAAILSFFS